MSAVPQDNPEARSNDAAAISVASVDFLDLAARLGVGALTKALRARLIDVQVGDVAIGGVAQNLARTLRWRLCITNNGASAAALTRLNVPAGTARVSLDWPAKTRLTTPGVPIAGGPTRLHLLAPGETLELFVNAEMPVGEDVLEAGMEFRWLKGGDAHYVDLKLPRQEALTFRIATRD